MFVRTRILQNDAIDLRYEPDDASAGDLPSLLMISFIHFLPTALSPKTNQNSLAIGHYAQKFLLNLNFLTDANSTWLRIQGFEYHADFFVAAAADLDVRKAQSGKQLGYYFMERLLLIFSSVIKKMVAGMTLRIPLRPSQGKFVFIRKEAAKHFKVKKIKQIFLLEN